MTPSRAASKASGVTDAFVSSVLATWTAGGSVRRRTPSGLHLHLDRPLPFKPRILDDADAGRRLAKLRDGASVLALVEDGIEEKRR